MDLTILMMFYFLKVKIFIPKVDAFIENIDQHKYIINIHHWEGLYEN